MEFEQVIKTQKKEQVDEILSLQEQINQLKGISKFAITSFLEKVVEPIERTPGEVARTVEREPLLELLQKFLQQYAQYYFSPLRIKNWGAKLDGFHELDSYSKEEINQGLQRLLVMGKVRTKISKKGSTLYGIR